AAGLGLTLREAGAKIEGEKEVTSASESEGTKGAKLKRQVWKHTPVGQSKIDSTPIVAGKNLYAGIIHGPEYALKGKVHCFDRETGQPVWKKPFDAEGTMKVMFSSPCIVDGRLYIGEGFHTNADCRLFCLNAATGEKIWTFPKDDEEE